MTAEGERVFEADKVIVATGSRAAGLPFLKADGRTVITSTEALELAEVPKSLLVIGAGAIGLEMGSIYRRLGTDVTVLEIMPQILPGSDKEAVTRLERALKKQGLKIFTEMRIDEAEVAEGAVTLRGSRAEDQRSFRIPGRKGAPLGRPEAQYRRPLRRPAVPRHGPRLHQGRSVARNERPRHLRHRRRHRRQAPGPQGLS